MESHFYAYMYRLKYIERWSLMRNTTRETVAEHSYHVALLVHMLCEIGNRVYGRRLNADKAAAMALFHDATEVFTGDIPTPVKHHNPKMLASFREIEGMAAERLLGMVPPPLREAYEPLLLPGQAGASPAGSKVSDPTAASVSPEASNVANASTSREASHSAATSASPEASNPAAALASQETSDSAAAEAHAARELLRYLKAADLLDAYLKCLSELSAGNREFMVARGQTEQALAKLEMPEVEWFLTHMAPSFGKTLDELSEP